MNDNSALVDLRNPSIVRQAGLKALTKESGAVGAAYFLRQFGTGRAITLQRETIF